MQTKYKFKEYAISLTLPYGPEVQRVLGWIEREHERWHEEMARELYRAQTWDEATEAEDAKD